MCLQLYFIPMVPPSYFYFLIGISSLWALWFIVLGLAQESLHKYVAGVEGQAAIDAGLHYGLVWGSVIFLK